MLKFTKKQVNKRPKLIRKTTIKVLIEKCTQKLRHGIDKLIEAEIHVRTNNIADSSLKFAKNG